MLNFKPRPVLKLLEQYRCRNTCVLQNILTGEDSLKLDRIAVFHAGQSNIILPNIAQKIHGLALILFKSMLMQCVEAANRGVLCKKVFLKISQKS